MSSSRTASWFTPRLRLSGVIATGLIAVGLVAVGCVDRGESVVAEGDVRDPDPPILELTPEIDLDAIKPGPRRPRFRWHIDRPT